MIQIAAVFLGGGLGALLRWQSQVYLNASDRWPWGTFLVNIVGGFLAGCILAAADRLSSNLRLFLMTGILGGLTTFSALSYEMIGMINRGEMLPGLSYGVASLIAATLVCWLGFFITSRFVFIFI